MRTFPISLRLLKGGIVLLDPETGRCGGLFRCNVIRTHSRARCTCRARGTESGDRLEALRLKASRVEAIKLEAKVDAIKGWNL